MTPSPRMYSLAVFPTGLPALAPLLNDPVDYRTNVPSNARGAEPADNLECMGGRVKINSPLMQPVFTLTSSGLSARTLPTSDGRP